MDDINVEMIDVGLSLDASSVVKRDALHAKHLGDLSCDPVVERSLSSSSLVGVNDKVYADNNKDNDKDDNNKCEADKGNNIKSNNVKSQEGNNEHEESKTYRSTCWRLKINGWR